MLYWLISHIPISKGTCYLYCEQLSFMYEYCKVIGVRVTRPLDHAGFGLTVHPSPLVHQVNDHRMVVCGCPCHAEACPDLPQSEAQGSRFQLRDSVGPAPQRGPGVWGGVDARRSTGCRLMNPK